MNSKIKAILTEKGMTVKGNLAYGIVCGYETNAVTNPTTSDGFFKMHVASYTTDEQKREIDAGLQNLGIKGLTYSFTPYGILFGLTAVTIFSFLKQVSDVIDSVFGVLQKSGAPGSGYCPVCGKPFIPSESNRHNLGGFTVSFDDECLSKINEEIDRDNREFDDAPNNYLQGFFGALIGGVVGGILSGVFYLAGFFASISAFVAVLLGAFLYQKFRGKPNKGMLVIVGATSLVCVLASIFLTYLIASFGAAAEAGVGMSAMEAFLYLMQDAEFSKSFYTDLGMTALFWLIGAGLEIGSLSRKYKRTKTIR